MRCHMGRGREQNRIDSKNNKSAESKSGADLTDSEISPDKTPPIEGTDEFKETIQGVLNLAKEKDIELYYWYIVNADKIKLAPINEKVLAMNVGNPFTNEAVVLLDEDTFNKAKLKYTKQDLTIFYVGLLAHECAHTTLYGKNLYTDDDLEALCNINAARAVERVDSSDSKFYKFFKDYVYLYPA